MRITDSRRDHRVAVYAWGAGRLRRGAEALALLVKHEVQVAVQPGSQAAGALQRVRAP